MTQTTLSETDYKAVLKENEELRYQLGMANLLISIGERNIEYRTHAGLDLFKTYRKKYSKEAENVFSNKKKRRGNK